MNFSESFQHNKGQAILVDGREIVPMLRIAVGAEDRVRIVWKSAIEAPVQGIRVKLDRGKLAVADQDLADVVLWRDTAPAETVLVCRCKGAAELRVWNCWRDGHGVMQAWVGNAGMRAEEREPRVFAVECNSRLEVTFKDLVFDVAID